MALVVMPSFGCKEEDDEK